MVIGILSKNYWVKEFAPDLSVSTRTIQREISKGNLVAGKVGRKYCISQKGLDEYLSHNHLNIQKELADFIDSQEFEMISLL